MKFREGDEVRLLFDVVSDGTVYGTNRGQLLMNAGKTGFVKKVGIFLDDYVVDVHFLNENRVIGCREHELIDAHIPWSPPAFAKKDRVKTIADIKKDDSVFLPINTPGIIRTIDYHDDLGYIYEVEFSDEKIMMMGEKQIEKEAS